MKSASVKKERNVLPYNLPIDAAEHYCHELDKKEYVSWYDLLAVVVISGIALEALVNTFGEILFKNFKDFESSTPIAKTRLICGELGVKYSKDKKPFCDLIRLVKVRNKIVHPKYSFLSTTSEEMPIKKAQKELRNDILTKTERTLNPTIAKQSMTAVKTLQSLFENKLIDSEKKEHLREWSRSELVCPENG